MKTAIVVSVSKTAFEALASSNDVGAAFELARRNGFNAVEIAVRDPALVSAPEIAALAKNHGLAIAAIGTGQAWVEEGLSLSNPDQALRSRAMERMKAQLRLGRELGAHVIVGLIRGTAEKSEVPIALDRLAESLAELGRYAREVSAPGILFEPINRYETRLINSVDEAVEFLARLGDLPVRILADTFHMNIEDRDLPTSLKKCGRRLGHVHFADSNRWAPGQGHIDFDGVVQALREMGYDGYLSAEIMPLPSTGEAFRLTGEFFQKMAV